jgi:phosphatidylserine synthase
MKNYLKNKSSLLALMAIMVCPVLFLASCNISDDNDAPVYGKENGLPVNCRAFVQFAINEYRAGKYSANDTMSALERNCGSNGWSWKNIREKHK